MVSKYAQQRACKRGSCLRFAGVLSLSLGLVGCTAFPDSNTSPRPSPPPDNTQPPPPSTVELRFVNLTDAAVATEIYVADGPLENLPDDLITAEHRVLEGIGVAGTGIMSPFSADSIERPCADDLVVGTGGGRFMDADSGEFLGQGPVRFLQAGFQFDCGTTLIFEYSRTADGYNMELYQDRSGPDGTGQGG